MKDYLPDFLEEHPGYLNKSREEIQKAVFKAYDKDCGFGFKPLDIQ